MRKMSLCLVAVMSLSLMIGCAQNKTRIGEGAGIGAILGAAAGGIIGHQSGSGVEGALIGGAVGAIGGGAVGAQMPKDHMDGQYVQRTPVTMQQIVDWSIQGLPSEEIINRMRTSNSTYSLTTDDVNYLKKQGVSQRVIEAMQGS